MKVNLIMPLGMFEFIYFSVCHEIVNTSVVLGYCVPSWKPLGIV